ncbi:hypothetical protein EWM64_g8600 [Hericium alpestre]|uniref:Uncharacterized protein n=1 Tax=Hericium alpestre TaxID=135208 RepID=A0A4Y9ZNJ1_9AGAM|nr:hypothetical protein EWM64_g8600 [Hericium alpestre]
MQFERCCIPSYLLISSRIIFRQPPLLRASVSQLLPSGSSAEDICNAGGGEDEQDEDLEVVLKKTKAGHLGMPDILDVSALHALLLQSQVPPLHTASNVQNPHVFALGTTHLYNPSLPQAGTSK